MAAWLGEAHFCLSIGTIFFLTTNYRDRLDKALIRPGRVDVQVKLEHASDDQIGRMLSRFYEEASMEQRASFVRAVRAAEGGRRISCAQLQEHFVQHRAAAATSEMTAASAWRGG